MPTISLQFESSDFKGLELPVGVVEDKLRAKFDAEFAKIPRSVVQSIQDAATTLRNSMSQTCLKVQMQGTGAAFVFVRYTHDPADVALLSGGQSSESQHDAPQAADEGGKDDSKGHQGGIVKPVEKSNHTPRSGGVALWGDDKDDAGSPPRRRSASPPPRRRSPSPPPRRRSPSPPPRHRSRSPPPTKHSGDVATMSCYDVSKWLLAQGLVKYADNFEHAQVDGRALVVLRTWCVKDTKGFFDYCREELGVMRAGHTLQLMWCLQYALD